MINISSDIRLTDELERKLMQEAIEAQNRFKPGIALKNLFVKLAASKVESARATAAKFNETAA